MWCPHKCFHGTVTAVICLCVLPGRGRVGKSPKGIWRNQLWPSRGAAIFVEQVSPDFSLFSVNAHLLLCPATCNSETKICLFKCTCNIFKWTHRIPGVVIYHFRAKDKQVLVLWKSKFIYGAVNADWLACTQGHMSRNPFIGFIKGFWVTLFIINSQV